MTPELIEWRSVDEAMPELNSCVLVALGNGVCAVGYRSESFGDWCFEDTGQINVPVLAWAPLPKGPQ